MVSFKVVLTLPPCIYVCRARGGAAAGGRVAGGLHAAHVHGAGGGVAARAPRAPRAPRRRAPAARQEAALLRDRVSVLLTGIL